MQIDNLMKDPHMASMVNTHFKGPEKLRLEILGDFFRHGFDGSGDDGTTCHLTQYLHTHTLSISCTQEHSQSVLDVCLFVLGEVSFYCCINGLQLWNFC